MKKILFIVSVATAVFAFNANALEVKPYVSAKLKYSFMDNNVKGYLEEYDEYWGYDSWSEKINIDDNVFGGSLAVGASTPLGNGAFRAELEYNRNVDAEKEYKDDEDNYKFKLKSQSLLVNMYYDFDTGTKFTPYLGAGIGGAKLKVDVVDGDSIDDTTLAWQIGAGVAYAVTDNFCLDAGYRYVNYGSFSDKDGEEDEYQAWYEKDKVDSQAHEIYLGVRYSF